MMAQEMIIWLLPTGLELPKEERIPLPMACDNLFVLKLIAYVFAIENIYVKDSACSVREQEAIAALKDLRPQN